MLPGFLVTCKELCVDPGLLPPRCELERGDYYETIDWMFTNPELDPLVSSLPAVGAPVTEAVIDLNYLIGMSRIETGVTVFEALGISVGRGLR